MRIILSAGLLVFAAQTQAQAQVLANGDEMTEICTEAKDLIKVVEAFTQADPAHVNLITPTFSMTVEGINGAASPDEINYKFGTQLMAFELDDEGVVQNLGTLVGQDADGEMCTLQPVRPADDKRPTMRAGMSMTFPYKANDGVHVIDDLVEGAKDGSKIMNSLAPKGMGLFVPSLKRIVIVPTDEAQPITVSLMRGNQPAKFEKIETADEAVFYIRVKDLKRAKADTLHVKGGPYTIMATFDD